VLAVFGANHWWNTLKSLITIGLICILVLGSLNGQDAAQAAGFFNRSTTSGSKGSSSNPIKLGGKVSETSPPEVIQQLRGELEQYQPQVSILSPKQNEVLQDNTVSLRFQVKDLPLFKDEELALGPHLHVFVDNQPYTAVYDTSAPLVLNDLPPGTHTVRAFASRPWHESFKNEGAYAQTTFHIFAKTQDNSPNPDLPLLTYSRPQGNYGAEPIMLDFYLTNAPLHLVAQESAEDDIADWRIRCTVNGSSFILDRWQPIYLKGFRPGKNWVQLEYLDEKGNVVSNVFNNTVRLITYEPNGKDTLSQLTRGELSLVEAKGIVDPNYQPELPAPEPSPEPIQPPTPEATPAPEPTPPEPKIPVPTPTQTPEVDKLPQPIEPVLTSPTSDAVEAPATEAPTIPEPETNQEATPNAEPQPTETIAPTTKPKASEQPNPKKFFDRFRRPSPVPMPPAPKATPVPPTVTESPTPGLSLDENVPQVEEIPDASRPEPKPDSELAPLPGSESTTSSTPEDKVISPEPSQPEEAIVPKRKLETPTPEQSVKPNLNKYFDRFRRSSPKPQVAPDAQPSVQPATEPEAVEMPSTEAIPPEPEELPAQVTSPE
jgi:hypothetical protein